MPGALVQGLNVNFSVYVNYRYSASEVSERLLTVLVVRWLECYTHWVASYGFESRICP